jgi:hypothetical protein
MEREMKRTFLVKELLRIATRESERLWDLSEQLDDLSHVIVILVVLGSRLRVKKVVAGDELEDLQARRR